jgi:hypothetical protein
MGLVPEEKTMEMGLVMGCKMALGQEKALV